MTCNSYNYFKHMTDYNLLLVSEQKRTCYFIGGVFGLAVIATLVALPIVLIITADDEPKACAGSCTLDDVPLVDGHNDLPYQIYNLNKNSINDFKFDSDLTADPIWANRHTDLLRLRKGKVGAQFWAAYVSCASTQAKDAVERTLEQIDIIKRLVRKYPNDMTLVTTSNGIWDAYKENKIGSLIGIEGGHSMDNRLAVLRMYYDLGVRYMTLTHSCNQPWVDASPVDDPASTYTKLNLTSYGEDVIREMNRLGMIVDLSHVSYGVMDKVLDISTAPVIFSHSSAYGVFAHHRNVPDDILLKLKENAGVIMINFYPTFTGGDNMAQVISKYFLLSLNLQFKIF